MPQHTSIAGNYARALADPVRLGIVAALASGPRTLDSLARDLDTSKRRLSGHARALAEMGLIRAIAERPRTYELLREPVLWEDASSELPLPAKRETLAAVLTHIHASASAAIDDGGFDRPDAYITRTALRMSDALWQEIATQFGDLLRRLDAADDDPDGTPATVVTMLFSGEHAESTAPGTPSPNFSESEARERTYDVVEALSDLMIDVESLPWDRIAALGEQLRLVGRAAASLEDARRTAPAERHAEARG